MGEIAISETFLVEKKSILAHISLKIHIFMLAMHVLLRHCDIIF